ncbi:MAG: YesL family protein [Candidatus Limiplasma sp.]|nr:YesL family protein [Candidatus Limiplasma sp.]
MFGKMMNSFYYGKSGKGDYRKEDLPQNRWQLFWEMLRIRLSGLCQLNLLGVVSWLPALFVALSAVMNGYGAMVSFAELQAAGDPAVASLSLPEYLQGLTMQTLLVMVPCIAITGPFTAGVAYVTRNWARDEHAFVWSDFRDAVKENWKQGLAISTITGFMPLVFYVCWMFYGEMAKTSAFFMVPQILSLTIVAIWLCSLTYFYPLMVTYKLRFRALLRNGLLLTIGRLPMSVGLKLLSLVPGLIAAVVAFFTPYIQWAVLGYGLYYLVIGFALSRFVGASYSNAVFDKYINPNIQGAVVGRGLYKEDEEDEEKSQEEPFAQP